MSKGMKFKPKQLNKGKFKAPETVSKKPGKMQSLKREKRLEKEPM